MNIIIFTDVNETMGFGRYAGAYKVASELRRNGYSVLVVDFFAEWELEQISKLADRYIGKDTLWVGFSTTLFQKHPAYAHSPAAGDHEDKLTAQCEYFPRGHEWMKEMFAILKSRNADLKIVVGGGRASNPPHAIPEVDFWVWGEADKSAVELTKFLDNKISNLTTVPARCGKIVPAHAYPYKDFSQSKIIWMPEDNLFPGEHLPIEVARGCAFNCSFCSHAKKRPGDLIKDDSALRDELIYNYETFGTTGYMLCDDTYNDSIQKVERLHKVFTSLPFKIEWSCFARIDIIHTYPQMRELLLESGMRSVQFGIETFNPNAAKKIGKPLHPDKVKDLLYFLSEQWKQKIIVTSGFIVGLPGESKQSILDTFEWLIKEDCPLDSFYLFALNIKSFDASKKDVIDFSKFSKDPKKYGYTKEAGLGWRNEHMNYEEAKVLAEELRIKRDSLGRNRKPGYTFYNRLRNLNFSFDELYFFSDHFPNVQAFQERHDHEKQALIRKYINRLLGVDNFTERVSEAR